MATLYRRFRRIFDSFIPLALIQHAETARKARLIVSFGFLGGAFGFSYAAFYLFIGHLRGAEIIILCSIAAVLSPLFLRFTGLIRLAGNCQALILTLGFFALGNVEGGVNGHAIAWLAGVPLCALMLADKYSALVWCVICFFATSYFCIVDLAGVVLYPSYDPRLHPLITAMGFMGLAIFMSILGIVFENGREKAMKRLNDAHTDLSRMNEQLIRLNHEKDEFLGIAAHDLKNRIHNIKGLAELITLSKSAGEDVQKDAEEIVHAAVRMQASVGNLLVMDALEEGRFHLTPQVCDLVDLTNRVIKNYHSAAARKLVRVEFKRPPAPVPIVADVDATMQVLDNLVSNALKYSPFGKSVYVEVASNGDLGEFTIRDEGQGFSDSDKRRLFGKFIRLSAVPTGGESSTGLGLSIVKKIIDTMGGSVRCESAPGAGATFIVTFPSGA
jgi:signal transduction histidine kinase